MKQETEIKNEVFDIIQKYLQFPPVVIWGSGATIPYGMPSMSDLNKSIQQEMPNFDGSSGNLEEELGKERYTDSLPQIRQIIWETIKNEDDKIVSKILNDDSEYDGIYQLINRCISAEPKVMNIITTNYDRVLEYVMSYHDILYTDGFTGKVLSSFDENAFRNTNIVNLIKVHGSLNWGQCDGHPRYLTSANLEPVIIPPGKNKYQETYHSPYRELIQCSDRFIKQAQSFLIIGFGFNDEHLTPKIKDKVEKGTPLVLITKEITASTKKELERAKKYVLIEETSNNASKIIIRNESTPLRTLCIKGAYWQLNKFMEEIL